MSKDVIYIEPSDDITDIIKKIENSKEKIVALVPPKKTNVLRSIVNIKLINKSGAKTGKKVVLVTNDPAVMKLAASVKLPVTKDLQSAPTVPKMEDIEADEEVSVEEIIKKPGKQDEEEITSEEVSSEEEEDSSDGGAEEPDEESEETKEGAEEDTKGKKKKDKKPKKEASERKFNNPVVGWIVEHKKLCIGGGIGLVLLVLLLVWAFGIAPAATVTVGIRTTKSNFSENVTFTETLTEENASEGKFFMDLKKKEVKAEAEFDATGQKNVGEKAKGELIIWAFLPIKGGSAYVSAGDTFSLGDLAFTADADASISWSGDLTNLRDGCANGKNNDSLSSNGCLIYGKVAVTAVAPGASYNIVASNTGWKAPARIGGAYSEEAMTGGTDKLITILQQSDIDNALAQLKTADEKVNKDSLYAEIPETSFIIDSSFTQTTGEAVATPKVGEEVKDGAKAKLSVVTTNTVFFIDKTKMEEFITEKAKLAEGFKIYNINEPFIENFIKSDAGYTGKLKASYVSGPKVTENDVLEIIKGKGLGTAQHDLKDINGISSIRIDVSYPWVMSIPSDTNKITVILDVEE